MAPYLALAALWLLTITIVPPRGDFPLNDDWMYAKVVQHLVETGQYQPTPYADPTFILQAYWGAAWAKVFGFSFETLRLSTLVLALVAIWAAHWAAREAGLNARWAFLVALTLLVNPLFMNLSYTFMTDVPFIALTLVSIAAYLRAYRTENVVWIAAATSICGAAFFVRQFALIPAIAALLLSITWLSEKNPQHRLKKIFAIFVPVVFMAILRAFLPLSGLGMSGGWDWTPLGDTWTTRIVEIGSHFSISFCYLALFMVPIAVAWSLTRSVSPAASSSRKYPALRIAIFVVAALLVTYLATRTWPYRLPNLGNVLYDLGVGPLLLPGMVQDSAIAAPVQSPVALWWIVTGFTILGATALALLHLRAARYWFSPQADRPLHLRDDFFLAMVSTGMVLVLILPPVLARFDRYLVMAEVPMSIMAVRWLSARQVQPARAAFGVATVLWLFSVVCLQDYLAWNAARWRAVVALQQTHAAPLEQINGGYEFNGWFHSDIYAEESRRAGKKVFGPKGWWIRGDDYRVSLRPNEHFEVIGTAPYFSWLGWQRREILLLKRTEPDENFAVFN